MDEDMEHVNDSSSTLSSSISSTASIPAAPIKAAPWGSTPNVRQAEDAQLSQLGNKDKEKSERDGSPVSIPIVNRSRDPSVSSSATVVAHLLPNNGSSMTPPGSPTRQKAMNGPTTRPTLSGVRSLSSSTQPPPKAGKSKDDFVWGDIIGEGSFSTVTLAWDKLPTHTVSSQPSQPSSQPLQHSQNHQYPQLATSPVKMNTSIPSSTSSSSSMSSQSIPPPKQARIYAMKELSQAHIVKENKIKYVTIEKHALQILNTDISNGSSQLRENSQENIKSPQQRKPKRQKNEGSSGIIRLWMTFREGRSAYRGSDHLHNLAGDSLFFALEYAPNGELLSWIKKMGSFDEKSAKFYAAQTLSVIGFMHGRGIIHRDIKPENILLNSDMVIKVTDFGSAKILDQSDADINDERSKSFVGTAEYVSPELLRDRSVGKECDFWALGCIIYQMITGKPPFKATNEYLTFQLIMKLDYVFPDNFPPVARDLVEKLLVLDPEDRLGSGEDGIEDIRNHEWFKDVNFQQIWSTDPPSIATGMNEPSPQSNIPSDAYFELGWEESDEDESEQIKDEQEEQQQQLRDEEDKKQTDEKTTSSPGFSSDSDYLAPLTLSSIVNDGKEMSDELKSQLYTILLPSEKLHLASPVLVRTQRKFLSRTKRRWLLLTDLPRLLCVKEDTLKVKFEVDLGIGDSEERARVRLAEKNKVIVSAGGRDVEFSFDEGRDASVGATWYAKVKDFLNSDSNSNNNAVCNGGDTHTQSRSR
ncbi:hypothetical protein E3P89_03169 [Wallemia ichthyophaga]|uniref:non-specific serine/threonine protein kinase n=1 Tax=Wallemia ichthyophaga TaxID=245174 RepID=A0A4T0I3K0_WALIC|nr:hypothetical protein E3P93_03159 [Wallemia ichthyophaga]TIB09686.1 hypothetical protein E3P90_03190 [Wallemia ichthyophaga]TIB20496.1 hypothetical protein E3P89_03169 [Wallemia ichthyophaga]TIB22062.1 hypothetical protein E3P88_03203 [Wallemia ichthyophaga]